MTIPLTKFRLRLMEVYFVLAFFALTCTYNVYIVFGAAMLLPWMLVARQRHRGSIVSAIVLTMLIGLYAIVGGDGRDVFRVFKTLVVFSAFYLADTFNEEYRQQTGERLKIPIIHGFMVFSAVLICVDTVLGYTMGFSIGWNVSSGMWFRASGPFQDSNFYTYTMVAYMMMLKYHDGRHTRLFITSILLSGSLSGIILMLFLLLARRRQWFEGKHAFRHRMIICFVTLAMMAGYFTFVSNSANIQRWVATTEMHPFIKLKSISMMLRFEAQADGAAAMQEHGDILFGVGAGETRNITTTGLNLHNTYYQILLEMGVVLYLAVMLALIYYMFRIKDIRFLLVYAGLFILGNMLEVYYFPILPFVWFCYKYKESYA